MFYPGGTVATSSGSVPMEIDRELRLGKVHLSSRNETRIKNEEEFRAFAPYFFGLGPMIQAELREKGLDSIEEESMSLCRMFRFYRDFDWRQFDTMRFCHGVYMKMYFATFRRNLNTNDILNVLQAGPCYLEEVDRICRVFIRFGLLDRFKKKYTFTFRMAPVFSSSDERATKFWNEFPGHIVLKTIRRQLRRRERGSAGISEFVYKFVPPLENPEMSLKSIEADLELLIHLDRRNIAIGCKITRDLNKRPFLMYQHPKGGSICADVVKKANIKDNEVVIDLACGAGTYLFEALSQHNCMCIGIERNDFLLKAAVMNAHIFASKYPKRASQIQFLNADLFSGFFNLFSVDVIICELVYSCLVGNNEEEYKEFIRKLVHMMSFRCRPQCRAVILLPQTHVVYLEELTQGQSSIEMDYSYDIVCPVGVGTCCVLRTI